MNSIDIICTKKNNSSDPNFIYSTIEWPQIRFVYFILHNIYLKFCKSCNLKLLLQLTILSDFKTDTRGR